MYSYSCSEHIHNPFNSILQIWCLKAVQLINSLNLYLLHFTCMFDQNNKKLCYFVVEFEYFAQIVLKQHILYIHVYMCCKSQNNNDKKSTFVMFFNWFDLILSWNLNSLRKLFLSNINYRYICIVSHRIKQQIRGIFTTNHASQCC